VGLRLSPHGRPRGGRRLRGSPRGGIFLGSAAVATAAGGAGAGPVCRCRVGSQPMVIAGVRSLMDFVGLGYIWSGFLKVNYGAGGRGSPPGHFIKYQSLDTCYREHRGYMERFGWVRCQKMCRFFMHSSLLYMDHGLIGV